jgi:ring-1,2-phenylacetyl-CoA epoxidase subunit PaaC
VSPADALLRYVLRLGDNALVTGQRMTERVTGEPELEEELANANFALDYIGQARLYYSYAGELEGQGRTEDEFAFLRDSQAFRNFLITEQPNGHFGDAIVRQVLFETFYLLQLEVLESCKDPRLAEIAARAVKEMRYHLRHASQWFIRLGDGTQESHRRMQDALERHWRYTGEFFVGDDVDAVMHSAFDGPDLALIRKAWQVRIAQLLDHATLAMPTDTAQTGGSRRGLHSEHLGYLVAEMQHLHRAHPGVRW